MRLSKSVSKNATSLYVIESTYIHGKSSTRTVESLGTLEELSKIHDDPIAWAKAYIDELNKKDDIIKDSNYNWGYDPINYNIPEGSYSASLSFSVFRGKVKGTLQA